MQAVAAEFSGCAEKFYCFLGEKSFDSKELKKNQQSRAEVHIAVFLSTWVLEFIYFQNLLLDGRAASV